MRVGLLLAFWAAFWAAEATAAEVTAPTPHVENRCPRLTLAAYEELDARVQLLLRADEATGPLPAVVCSDSASWVEWQGERIDVLAGGRLEDAFLDAIEARAHRDARAAEADPATVEAEAVARGEPMLAPSGTPPPLPSQRADPLAMRPSDARGGGITVGFQFEPPSDTIGWAMGPAFDFGGSVGPLLLQGREAFRFASVDGGNVMFMDFEAGLGIGAPLNPDARIGLVARGGVEWLVAYPEGNSGQASVVPIGALGLRLAQRIGLVTLWLGVDGHFRFSELGLRSSEPKIARSATVIPTLGVAFVDWSRK